MHPAGEHRERGFKWKSRISLVSTLNRPQFTRGRPRRLPILPRITYPQHSDIAGTRPYLRVLLASSTRATIHPTCHDGARLWPRKYLAACRWRSPRNGVHSPSSVALISLSSTRAAVGSTIIPRRSCWRERAKRSASARPGISCPPRRTPPRCSPPPQVDRDRFGSKRSWLDFFAQAHELIQNASRLGSSAVSALSASFSTCNRSPKLLSPRREPTVMSRGVNSRRAAWRR